MSKSYLIPQNWLYDGLRLRGVVVLVDVAPGGVVVPTWARRGQSDPVRDLPEQVTGVDRTSLNVGSFGIKTVASLGCTFISCNLLLK